jgi:hypothetical protein
LLPDGNHCKIFDITDRQVHTLNAAPDIYFIQVDDKIVNKVIKIRQGHTYSLHTLADRDSCIPFRMAHLSTHRILPLDFSKIIVNILPDDEE